MLTFLLTRSFDKYRGFPQVSTGVNRMSTAPPCAIPSSKLPRMCKNPAVVPLLGSIPLTLFHPPFSCEWLRAQPSMGCNSVGPMCASSASHNKQHTEEGPNQRWHLLVCQHLQDHSITAPVLPGIRRCTSGSWILDVFATELCSIRQSHEIQSEASCRQRPLPDTAQTH